MLILPLLEIEPASSARVVGTVDAIRRQLSAGGPLLYRYPPGTDGLAGGEGAFLPCSFWLVQALARTGRRDEAEALLDELLPLGGPLGLFGEEMDPATGEHLGNYPQALTHAALVQAVLALDDTHGAGTRADAAMLRATELAGFIGAGLAGAAYVPQIWHLTRERCSAGLSRVAFARLARGVAPGHDTRRRDRRHVSSSRSEPSSWRRPRSSSSTPPSTSNSYCASHLPAVLARRS